MSYRSGDHLPAFVKLVEDIGGAQCAMRRCPTHGLHLREVKAWPAHLAAIAVTDSPFVFVAVTGGADDAYGYALTLTEETARRLAASLTEVANIVAAEREKGGRA